MADRYWLGTTSTSFNNSANWSTSPGGSGGASIPTDSDTAIYDANSSANCDLDVNRTLNILKVESGFTRQLVSSASRTITIQQHMEINRASCFAFTSGNIITFDFDKSESAVSAFDGAGSSFGSGDIFVKYGANASVFADSTARSNCIYHFSANQDVVLVDGVYPNIIIGGILFAKYITADSSATDFNTYGSVDILQYRTNGTGTVRSTTHDIHDYDKEFFFESIHSSGIGEFFQFGHTTARFKSGSANFRLPVFGDVYTNFGNNTTNTFNVQYHKIVIEAGDDSTYYCYIQPGKTLDCNELVIRDGGRLYGPAEGNQVASAKIKSVKRPTVQGDWNFKQIADGIYESIDNIPTLPVTEGGTGLNTVAVNSLLIGQGQLPLSTLSLGSAGDVLAVNGAGNAIEWSSTGGTNIELDELSDVTITSPDELQVLIYDGSGWVNGWPEVKMIQIRNDEGSTIPAGAPLYSKGEIGGSNRILVGVADADDSSKMPCIGIAYEEMNTTTTKDNYGVVSGVYNTNISGFTGLSEGDILYVSTSGGLTHSRPTGASDLIQNVGIVLKTNGTICQGLLVSAIGRTNDSPNSSFLMVNTESTHPQSRRLVAGTNITLTDGGAGGDLTIAASGGGGAVSAVANGANNRVATFSSADALNGEANLTFNGSTLAVTGDLNVGSGDLFVDDSSGRVGIGIGTSPVNLLHVKGDNSITNQNSGGAASITVEQDGTGDAAINFLLTGVQRYIVGIDNSDNDKFKIQTGGTSLSLDAGTARQPGFAMDTNGNVGIGTTNPQANLHITSGDSGDAVLILEADTDNNLETDQPYIVFEQDGGVQNSAVGLTSGANTDNNALMLSNSVGSSGSQAGIVFKTGTTDGYTNAVERMRIAPAGSVSIQNDLTIGSGGGVIMDSAAVAGAGLANGAAATLFTVPTTRQAYDATIYFYDVTNGEYQVEKIIGHNTGSGVNYSTFGQVFSGAAAIGSLDAVNSSGTTLIQFTNNQGGSINYQAKISITHMEAS